jgi:hypothetical protein
MVPAVDMLHYCCTMHNDTHSVHNHLLKPWWGRPPCFQPFSTSSLLPCPDSTDAHCPFSVVGGPGPPTPKVASPLLGSAHTPLPEHGTTLSTISNKTISCLLFIRSTITGGTLQRPARGGYRR